MANDQLICRHYCARQALAVPDALVADCSTQACFIGRSKAKLGLGNPGAALKDAQAFINHQPNNEAGYSCKGMALEAQHRYTDAEAALVAGSCTAHTPALIIAAGEPAV